MRLALFIYLDLLSILGELTLQSIISDPNATAIRESWHLEDEGSWWWEGRRANGEPTLGATRDGRRVSSSSAPTSHSIRPRYITPRPTEAADLSSLLSIRTIAAPPHNSPFVSSRSASSSLAIQHHPSLRGSRDRTSLRSALRLWHGYKARPTSVSSKRLEVLRFALTLPHLVSPQGLRLAACCCSTWRLSQSALCSQPGRYGLERGMRA